MAEINVSNYEAHGASADKCSREFGLLYVLGRFGRSNALAQKLYYQISIPIDDGRRTSRASDQTDRHSPHTECCENVPFDDSCFPFFPRLSVLRQYLDLPVAKESSKKAYSFHYCELPPDAWASVSDHYVRKIRTHKRARQLRTC